MFKSRVLFLLCFLSALISWRPAVAQVDTPLNREQQAFLDAYDAVRANDRQAIARFKRQLKNYPLYPYILYHDYRLHLKNTPASELKRFLRDYKGTYMADQLYSRWLKLLAEKKQWQSYLNLYRPQKSTDLQCLHVQALANSKQTTKALTLAKPLWNKQIKLSKNCAPLEPLLLKHHRLTGSMIWQKIEKAMEKRQVSEAKKLSRYLSIQERADFEEWRKVYSKPHIVSQLKGRKMDRHIKRVMFKQAIKRLAKKNLQDANSLLKVHAGNFHLTKGDINELNRYIALRTAYRYAPEAKALLEEVNRNGAPTEASLRWQAQINLKNAQWLDLLDTIDLMPAEEQNEKQWRYWKARALEKTGRKSAANKLYATLSTSRSFYGFMAADRLNKGYQFNPNPVKVQSPEKLIKKYPSLRRIQELMAIDWINTSQVEWRYLLPKVNRDELQAIAVLAHKWKQHPQVIRSLAIAKKWDDIQLRFPTPHKQPVMQNAQKNSLDPAWIYGIIRRESAFSENVQSSAGAVGLMQLMPSTARYIGRKIGVNKVNNRALKDPERNIQLGSAYLSYLKEKYGGNLILATAAYNAGPKRVDSWIPETGSLEADQWIDSIPFTETREYVKAVMEYKTIFTSLLNKRYDRLHNFMANISQKNIAQATDAKHP
ncbi:transglycosylase SLT domain-containing protein [Thiomicrorhabdus sp.]|uniref:lytic transglycosylase domain-containing protein n=1 Tax=Thiomicrorhabdus sp. TaxID=2039724 RepID=UPI0029C8A984|nr:transglycosylase SLT domain-containing protein [Thiomicrorhabdus sp.]